MESLIMFVMKQQSLIFDRNLNRSWANRNHFPIFVESLYRKELPSNGRALIKPTA